MNGGGNTPSGVFMQLFPIGEIVAHNDVLPIVVIRYSETGMVLYGCRIDRSLEWYQSADQVQLIESIPDVGTLNGYVLFLDVDRDAKGKHLAVYRSAHITSAEVEVSDVDFTLLHVWNNKSPTCGNVVLEHAGDTIGTLVTANIDPLTALTKRLGPFLKELKRGINESKKKGDY